MSNLAEFTDAAHVAEQQRAREIVTPALVTRRCVAFTAPEFVGPSDADWRCSYCNVYMSACRSECRKCARSKAVAK